MISFFRNVNLKNEKNSAQYYKIVHSCNFYEFDKVNSVALLFCKYHVHDSCYLQNLSSSCSASKFPNFEDSVKSLQPKSFLFPDIYIMPLQYRANFFS